MSRRPGREPQPHPDRRRTRRLERPLHKTQLRALTVERPRHPARDHDDALLGRRNGKLGRPGCVGQAHVGGPDPKRPSERHVDPVLTTDDLHQLDFVTRPHEPGLEVDRRQRHRPDQLDGQSRDAQPLVWFTPLRLAGDQCGDRPAMQVLGRPGSEGEGRRPETRRLGDKQRLADIEFAYRASQGFLKVVGGLYVDLAHADGTGRQSRA